MGDDDGDGAAGPQPEDGAGQRFIAFGIEVRIWLVQHDQEWIAVESARECDALRLSGRECAALLADDGAITFR